MRLDRATADQLAALPTIPYDRSSLSVKVEGEHGRTYVAVMFKHPPRVEVFLVVPNEGALDAAEVDAAIARMVIDEPANS